MGSRSSASSRRFTSASGLPWYMCTTPGCASSVRLASTRMEPAGLLKLIQSPCATPSARASRRVDVGCRPRAQAARPGQPVRARVDEHRQARPGVQDERVVARLLGPAAAKSSAGLHAGNASAPIPGPRRSSSDETNSILPDGVGMTAVRGTAAPGRVRAGHRHAAGRRPTWPCATPVAAKTQSSASRKEMAGSAPPSGCGLSSGSSSPSRWPGRRRCRCPTWPHRAERSPARSGRSTLRVAAQLAALHRAAGGRTMSA